MEFVEKFMVRFLIERERDKERERDREKLFAECCSSGLSLCGLQ